MLYNAYTERQRVVITTPTLTGDVQTEAIDMVFAAAEITSEQN